MTLQSPPSKQQQSDSPTPSFSSDVNTIIITKSFTNITMNIIHYFIFFSASKISITRIRIHFRNINKFKVKLTLTTRISLLHTINNTINNPLQNTTSKPNFINTIYTKNIIITYHDTTVFIHYNHFHAWQGDCKEFQLIKPVISYT